MRTGWKKFRHFGVRKSKLRNTRISFDDIVFASKLELAIYLHLKNLEASGRIELLDRQCRISLTDAKIIYIPDFKCRDLVTKEIFFVEAKGFQTPDWKIKKRLWLHYGSSPLHIWRGNYKRPHLSEIIHPINSTDLKTKQDLVSHNPIVHHRKDLAGEQAVSQFREPFPAGKKGSK